MCGATVYGDQTSSSLSDTIEIILSWKITFTVNLTIQREMQDVC